LDAYAWSFEVGAVKPDGRIYEKVCADLGIRPERALIIGDTLDADYYGPKCAGMQAMRLDRNGTKQVPESIPSLHWLTDVLRELSTAI
jgi:FMN phosphatase YigB (HAD superfamily)